jgi:glycosyltransferase involved in cell wall biosynthesis
MDRHRLRPLEVAWITGSKVVGGAEYVTLALLAELCRRGHHVTCLCPAASPLLAPLAAIGVPAVHVPLQPRFDPRSTVAISRALREQPPDIALVTTSSDWASACLAPRRHRTRLVLVRHMALPLSAFVRRLAARRADAIVAVSEAVRRTLKGIPPQRLWLLPNAVRLAIRDHVPDAAERAGARKSLGLPPAAHWIGFFGGLSAGKGIADVLEACRAVSATIGPTYVLACGRSGDHQAAVPTTQGHRGALFYLGEIDAVEEAFTAADVVVIATHRTLSEALPAAAMEAMACGTPVVAYAVGGVSEVLDTDGRTGRLVRPDETQDLARVLADVLTHPHEANTMAAAALERVRHHFALPVVTDRYEQLFRQLAGSEKGYR